MFTVQRGHQMGRRVEIGREVLERDCAFSFHIYPREVAVITGNTFSFQFEVGDRNKGNTPAHLILRNNNGGDLALISSQCQYPRSDGTKSVCQQLLAAG